MAPEHAEVQAWLRKARADRRTAEAALSQTPPITDTAAFHCQPAVEKCLKAYLVHRGEPFELVHDLEALVDQCVRLDADWQRLRDRVEPLTAYAVRFRYPGPADPTADEVRRALETVAAVWKFVTDRMPPESGLP